MRVKVRLSGDVHVRDCVDCITTLQSFTFLGRWFLPRTRFGWNFAACIGYTLFKGGVHGCGWPRSGWALA